MIDLTKRGVLPMKNRLSALTTWVLVAVLLMGTAGGAWARHDEMQNEPSSEGDPGAGFHGIPETVGGSGGQADYSIPEEETTGKPVNIDWSNNAASAIALNWSRVVLFVVWPATGYASLLVAK